LTDWFLIAAEFVPEVATDARDLAVEEVVAK
jgi:hypothetical protein